MMRRALSRALLLAVLLGSAAAGYAAHAQLTGSEPLTLDLNPQYPGPYQTVIVTPESSSVDLSGSSVTFTVNGKVIQQGTGGAPAHVTLGGPGSITKVTVTATYNGSPYSSSVTIRPADVALIVEPVSSTHPFYEGGALVGDQGSVRIIAMPDLRNSAGVQISPSSLEYVWKNGDQILQSSSGIGRSVLSATAPVQYRNTTVTVTVSTPDQSIVGQAAVLIAPSDPLVRIYENDPLLGPRYETALPESISLTESEATYRAVPYYFTSTPNLTWNLNGSPSQTGRDITVRPAGGGKGTALLGVSATTGALGQSASSNLSVRFGQKGSGLFGL
jgi:hypothetical protein